MQQGGDPVVNGDSTVIWTKTDAGRVEMQSRAVVKERALRNLLLLIDGRKPEQMLLQSLAGIGQHDFFALQDLGLIAPSGSVPATAPGALAPVDLEVEVEAASETTDAAPLDYAQFTAALTQIISKELGLRGFMLTLAVEKAATAEALQDVARRTLAQVRTRKGDAAEAAARRQLFGH